MIINQFRNSFYSNTTISSVNIKSAFFGYALEDTVRPFGIKVPKFTAIPENIIGYKVGIKYSHHFKRDVVVLYTDIINSVYTIKLNGITFTNVYAHGGNDISDTDGCIIVAKHTGIINGIPKVWRSLESVLFNLIKSELDNNNEVIWKIKNNQIL